MATIKTRMIYKGPHYTACVLYDGSLCITRNRARGGVQLVGKQAPKWIAAIEEAVAEGDKQLAHRYCVGVLNG